MVYCFLFCYFNKLMREDSKLPSVLSLYNLYINNLYIHKIFRRDVKSSTVIMVIKTKFVYIVVPSGFFF